MAFGIHATDALSVLAITPQPALSVQIEVDICGLWQVEGRLQLFAWQVGCCNVSVFE